MLGRIAGELITLFVVLDPVGMIPVFLHATARLEPRDRREVAFAAVLAALLVLLLFLYCGQYVLAALHVGIPAFRVAGAATLFLLALRMIFGEQETVGFVEASRSPTQIALFPVALPGIAGPGALLAVVLLADNHRYSFTDETITAGLTLLAMGSVLAALLSAARLQRLLGPPGITVISQIMGLILAAFSVQQVLDGIVEVFGRPLS